VSPIGHPTGAPSRSYPTAAITASSCCSQPDQPIRFIAASTSRDSLPAWSPDDARIAFLRQPAPEARAIANNPARAVALAIQVADVAIDGNHYRRHERQGAGPIRFSRTPGRHQLSLGATTPCVHLYRMAFPTLVFDPASRIGRPADVADTRFNSWWNR